MKEQHVWEFHGIGVAPFRVKGVASLPSKSLGEANPDAYRAALAGLPRGFHMGTCEVCGRSITVNFLIVDAQGRRFSVGSSCVNKSGDRGMKDRVRLLKNKRDRERRHAKREADRLERLEAERQANGGLTNYEVEEKRIKEAKAKRDRAMAPIIIELGFVADQLDDCQGGFRTSIANRLLKGEIPTGRGFDIMIEILAKLEGRKGSKSYEAEKARLEEFFEGIQTMINSID